MPLTVALSRQRQADPKVRGLQNYFQDNYFQDYIEKPYLENI